VNVQQKIQGALILKNGRFEFQNIFNDGKSFQNFLKQGQNKQKAQPFDLNDYL